MEATKCTGVAADLQSMNQYQWLTPNKYQPTDLETQIRPCTGPFATTKSIKSAGTLIRGLALLDNGERGIRRVGAPEFVI